MSDYKEQKKGRNRLSWIKKRFTIIENELKNQRSITQDPANGDDYELLQKAMETMTILESKYLELMEEQESLNTK